MTRCPTIAIASCVLTACSLDLQRGQAAILTLDFNSGVDSFGTASGLLVFNGPVGFSVTLDDDGSSAAGAGVRITNQNPGNFKVGSSDLVIGALDTAASTNHSSGIVAKFSQGVDWVILDDTDDDATTKALYAFDSLGNLIGQTPFASQIPFNLSLADTGGMLIYSVELDTLPGTAGGVADGTVFTVDNLIVSYTPVPEPSTLALAAFSSISLLAFKRRRGRH